MEFNQFIKYLHQPATTTTDRHNTIEALAAEYPYFVTAQWLLVQKSSAARQPDAVQKFKHFGLYMPLNSNLKTTETPQITPKIGVAPQVAPIVENITPIIKTPPQVADINANDVHNLLAEFDYNTPQATPPIENIVVKIEPIIETPPQVAGMNANDVHNLLAQFQYDTPQTTPPIEIEQKAAPTIENIAPKIEPMIETPPQVADITTNDVHNLLAQFRYDAPDIAPKIANTQEEIDIPDYDLSDFDTEPIAQTTTPPDPTTHTLFGWFDTIDPRTAIPAPTTNDLENLYKENNTYSLLENKTSKTNLEAINEFLTFNKVSKNTETIDLEQLAQKSLNETQLPASQTLAKIYENQHDYAQALNIYEQLVVKNPNRIAYFAQKIAHLRQLITKN